MKGMQQSPESQSNISKSLGRDNDVSETVQSQILKKRMFIPLAIATFSTGLSESILALFTTDIAKTFFGKSGPVAVAAVTQLSTINIFAEIIFALLLSFLVIRFRHKPLLQVGALLIVISAIGSYFAPTLIVLQMFYALEGAGSIIISIIAMTLIADALPPQKRAKVIGYLFSIGAAVTLIMIPLVGLLTQMGGWRAGLVFLVLPISVIALIVSSIMLPKMQIHKNMEQKTNPYLESFRAISKNRSALACLIASLLTVAGTEVAVFAIAFYRNRFGASVGFTVLVYEIAVLLFFIAPLVSGRLIQSFGSKRIALISVFLAACFTGTFFFVSNIYIAVVLDMMHVWFAAMAWPAFACLVLELMPQHRSTLFSLNSLFNNVGKVIAPALGGLMLYVSSGIYGTVGLALSSMTIVGSIVLLFFVKSNGSN